MLQNAERTAIVESIAKTANSKSIEYVKFAKIAKATNARIFNDNPDY